MWMILSPYPNLCQAEKVKSVLRILQEDVQSVYLTHDTNSRKSVNSINLNSFWMVFMYYTY